jgi:hypothetical protein
MAKFIRKTTVNMHFGVQYWKARAHLGSINPWGIGEEKCNLDHADWAIIGRERTARPSGASFEFDKNNDTEVNKIGCLPGRPSFLSPNRWNPLCKADSMVL